MSGEKNITLLDNSMEGYLSEKRRNPFFTGKPV